MRIYPPTLEISEKEGFTEKDIFELKDLGEGMTRLVSNISDPLVIAFNGKWGTGKTVFLKMWAGELRELNFPVIFFDAFENDYVDDAFAVLAREIIELAEKAKPKDKKIIDNFRKNSIRLGTQLLKGVAKVGTKALIRVVTADVVNDKDLKKTIQEISDEAAEEYMSEFLNKPKEQRDIVANFRKALEELPALIAPPKKEEGQKPLVFIIDELDRCKPLFALQIIERIKHFMSVPNVHFVFGVHLEQLERSVQFAYGADIDATTYLQKFINVTVSNSDNHEKHVVKYLNFLETNLSLESKQETKSKQEIEFLKHVALEKGYSFRTLERICTNIITATAFTRGGKRFSGELIAGLCILKIVEPKLFLKAKNEQLKYDEIQEIFGFGDLSPENENYEPSWRSDWWEYIFDRLPPEKLVHFDNFYNFDKKIEILTYIANNIVDRLEAT